MYYFTKVRWLVIVLVMLLVSPAVQATAYAVDATYCDGLALMNKATSEAKQRGEPLAKWKENLRSIKERPTTDKTSLMYVVMPQAISDAERVYKTKQKPVDQYVSSYRSCMLSSNKVVVVY